MAEPKSQAQADVMEHLQEVRRQAANSFALLRAITRWSAESATSLDSYAWHMEGRIDVIGRILMAAMRKPGTRFDLHRLLEDELNDQHAGNSANTWSLEGPPVSLDAASAEVLGLLIYELVANSIEHGALGADEGGELQVRWTVEQAGEPAVEPAVERGGGPVGEMLRLDWVERGAAPAGMHHEGFGSMVMDGMLRYQLDGSAERALGPDGVRISVQVPMRHLLRGDAGPALD